MSDDVKNELLERKKAIEAEFNRNNQQVGQLGEQRGQLNNQIQQLQIRQTQLQGENKQVDELLQKFAPGSVKKPLETPPDPKKKEGTEKKAEAKK